MSGSSWWGVFHMGGEPLNHSRVSWSRPWPHKARVIGAGLGREISPDSEFSRLRVSVGPLLCILMLFSSTLGMFWSLFAVMWKCCHLLMSTVWMRNYWFSCWALITDSFVSAAWKLWFRLGGKTSRRLVTGENARRQPQTNTITETVP